MQDSILEEVDHRVLETKRQEAGYVQEVCLNENESNLASCNF